MIMPALYVLNRDNPPASFVDLSIAGMADEVTGLLTGTISADAEGTKLCRDGKSER
jgi:hypothetical protein